MYSAGGLKYLWYPEILRAGHCEPDRRKGVPVSMTAGAISLLLVLVALAGVPARAAGIHYYVDCSSPTNGDGTFGSPWNSLTSVNTHRAFQPGDSVLLKRGVTCPGGLSPHGSGNGTGPGSFISVDAYGAGPRPVIDAGSTAERQAVLLVNQQYWQISNIETTGGADFGINVDGASNATLHHIWLLNDVIHDAKAQGGAAVCVCAGGEGNFAENIDDVLIDGLTVFNSPFDGIFVSGTHVTIRNSTVHDVGGSGMWVGGGMNVTMERNLVHDIGSNPQTGGDIGIWEFLCTDCLVQFNEVYNTTSGDLADGGAFDVDYDNVNNTVQYNYAHDTDGYCVSVFGATDQGITPIVTTNVVVRYNVCANTGLGPLRHPGFNPEGSIYIETWAQGHLDGIEIYNNTFYTNPAAPVPVLDEVTDVGFNLSVAYTGTRRNFFKNNIVYSTVPQILYTTPTSKMQFDNNVYWLQGGSESETEGVNRGKHYEDFAVYRQQTGQDVHSLYADPSLGDPTYHGFVRPVWQVTPLAGSPVIDAGVNVCLGVPDCSMGKHDFLGTPIPQGNAFDIGAVEFKSSD